MDLEDQRQDDIYRSLIKRLKKFYIEDTMRRLTAKRSAPIPLDGVFFAYN